jgi:lipoprotein-anchoring transpeptidase ErfK/SrfK
MHATPVASSIGQSVTHGCMRVPTDDARWLMRHIPLGTQVSIRA